MSSHNIRKPLFIVAIVAFLAGGQAEAQWKKILTDSAENAAKRETSRQVNKVVTGAIRCAVGEIECLEKAEEAGEPVVFTDENGEIIYDKNGDPVTDADDLPKKYKKKQAKASSSRKPATVSDSYDFEEGDRILFVEDYSFDNIGDFPQALTFREGDVAVVELNGSRALRLVGDSEFDISLPETLPEQFTIEFDIWLERHQTVVLGSPGGDRKIEDYLYPYHRFQVTPESNGTGITAGHSYEAPRAVKGSIRDLVGQMNTIRIMVDGNHGKMYFGETRVANLPNGDFVRDRILRFRLDSIGNEPAYVGAFRIAAGGRDLYDALEADGRVAVHDIHFDTDAATIRSESDATLNQIGQMLNDHPDLKVLLEGHTDSTGDFDHNMDLSKNRAEAVKQWLVSNRGVEASRLRCLGLGSTQAKDTNDTETGRQKNRRVELVKL